ncbi:phosphate signaling complex protein PhoU [candidate division KSB1 bacterium]|nr:phosphate signaling complex protein PhoU [candidate division KSB1 bacterium]
MAVHLQKDLEKLKKITLEVGTIVEESISRSVTALTSRNRALAEQVIAGDLEIDRREVQLEEECLKILALHQPVAKDLRFVVAVLKMNNDLERMGDYAANVAERSVALSMYPDIRLPDEVATMAEKVVNMVRKSLDCVVEGDSSLASAVCASDDEVDALHRGLFVSIQQYIKQDVSQLEPWIQLLSVIRYLERIADLATNIAQDVIYMVEGSVVRHRHLAR